MEMISLIFNHFFKVIGQTFSLVESEILTFRFLAQWKLAFLPTRKYQIKGCVALHTFLFGPEDSPD